MRRFFFAFLLGGIFLLMLSTLVVSDTCAETPAASDRPPEHTVLVTMPASMPETPAKAGSDDTEDKASFLTIGSTADCDFPKAIASDANGRVLTALRYENSFYQVFHPEVAGG